MSTLAARAASLAAAFESGVRREPVWIVTTLLLVWFSWPTLVELNRRWGDYGYQHGYLVLVLCAVLVARECHRAPLSAAKPSLWGVLCVGIAGMGVVAGNAASVQTVAEVLLPIAWLGAVWAVAGSARARRLVAPLAYFYFAIPIWDALNEPLRALTVVVVSAWLRTAAVPAFIDGNLIHLPSGTFEVAGGCSGLHFVVVGAALAALLGLLNHERWAPRVVLVVIAVGLSLLANWVRVFVIVVAGHVTQMEHFLVVEDHYYFGWVLFMVMLSPVIYVDRRLQDAEEDVLHRPTAISPNSERIAPFGRAIVLVTLMMIGIGGWLGQRLQAEQEPDFDSQRIAVVPADGWQRVAAWSDNRRPVFDGAASDDGVWFANGDQEIGVYVANYPRQRPEHEVVSSANRPEGSAQVVARSLRSASIASGSTVPFRELEVVDGDGARRLVWTHLRVAGISTINDIEAKLLQVMGAITGRRDAQALVLTAVCADGCEGARRLLDDYTVRSSARFYSCGNGEAPVFRQAYDSSCD